MGPFLIRRLVRSVFVLFAASFIIFIGVANAGDPFQDLRGIQDQGQAQMQIEERTREWNLDQPVVIRYFLWLGAALQGDFGTNFRNQDVSGLIAPAIGATIQLVLAATILAIIFGIITGIVSALRQYSGFDYTITFLGFLFFSLPVFWVATMLKEYGAIRFNDWLRDPVIPPAVIAAISIVSGLVWMAIAGGTDRQRRLSVLAVATASTAALLTLLSVTRWFADPGIGPVMVTVLAMAIAVGVAFIVSGFGYKAPLYAALVSAGVGIAASWALRPVLEDPTWLIIFGLLIVTIVVSLGIGYAIGGLQRRQAMVAATVTGVLTGGVVFFDHMLQAYSAYFQRVGGRPVSTIGSKTPNFSGTFWETGLDTIGHLILPTTALILISYAVYTRYTRASMLEVLNMDYVRTARAKGLVERTVVTKHAFRNALIPITTIMALDFGAVISGAVITETIFGWEGMGRIFIRGLQEVDPNPVMAVGVIVTMSVVVFNMIADILYAYLDPRIRVS